MIIPSIDLMDGKAVQLEQGKVKKIERTEVLDLAKKFNLYGEVAVIDLDATLTKGDNIGIIEKIAKIADVRIGGGIRTIEKAEEILSFGPKKIIIGTKATPDFLSVFTKSRIIAAVDSKGEYVVDNGWRSRSSVKTADKIIELEDYCSEFLYTDVAREGMLQGIKLDRIKELNDLSANKFTYAGGITTIQDYLDLEKLGINSQIGMSIYDGSFDLRDAFISSLDFEKQRGLIPSIVQDMDGNILMQGYSSLESLDLAFLERRGIFYSRSRNEIWRKGETSGNIQELVKIRMDCDYDTLLFTVNQQGNSCHKQQATCFGDKDFSLAELYNILEDRIENPIPGSYTSSISNTEESIKTKIKEEVKEVLNYTDRKNLVWEIADLTYFMMLFMAKKGITLDEVKNELWSRRR